MTLRERLDAMAAGRQAALAGEPLTACPHRQDTPDGRALASAWVREWSRNAPGADAAISYED